MVIIFFILIQSNKLQYNLYRLKKNIQKPWRKDIHIVSTQITKYIVDWYDGEKKSRGAALATHALESIDRIYLKHLKQKPASKVRSEDLFSYKVLLFPLNYAGGGHWWLLAIFHPGKVEQKLRKDRTSYLIIDPMNRERKYEEPMNVFRLLNRLWLFHNKTRAEVKETHGDVFRSSQGGEDKHHPIDVGDNGPFKEENLNRLVLGENDFIAQPDVNSCGVFTCMYCYSILLSNANWDVDLGDPIVDSTDSNLTNKYEIPWKLLSSLLPDEWAAHSPPSKEAFATTLTTRFRKELRMFFEEYNEQTFVLGEKGVVKQPDKETLLIRQQRLTLMPRLPEDLVDKLQGIHGQEDEDTVNPDSITRLWCEHYVYGSWEFANETYGLSEKYQKKKKELRGKFPFWYGTNYETGEEVMLDGKWVERNVPMKLRETCKKIPKHWHLWKPQYFSEKEQQIDKCNQLVSCKYDKNGMNDKFFLGRNATGEVEALEKKWMMATFDFQFLEKVKTRNGDWIQIPAGSTRKVELEGKVNMFINDSSQNQNTGKSKPNFGITKQKRKRQRGKSPFVQGKKPKMWLQGNDRTCVFTSFANCMSFLNKRELAETIQQKAISSINGGNPFEELIKLMSVRGEEFKRPVIFKDYKFQPVNMRANLPTVAQLCARDGGIEHAVTFFGDWIFESNQQQAMQLSEANLDKCVIGGFWYVKYAVRFHPLQKR